jgi:hypothetical protein
MRRSFSVARAGRRARAVALSLAVVAAAGLPAGAVGISPAAPAPAMLGDRVLATFTGTIKGIVVLREGSDGRMGISVALAGTPSGTVRLVGSPDACSTPLPSAIRSFSLPFTPLRWVRTTVSGLMEEEGIWYYRSIRLVKPGVPNRQLACRNVRYLRLATAPTVAIELQNVLISSYVVPGGVRGMIAAGPGTGDPVPLVATIARRAPGATYRLVGSTAPCGTSHQANETVFDRTFPTSGVITRGITADDDWEALTSFRIFRGTGFSQQARCIGDAMGVFGEHV